MNRVLLKFLVILWKLVMLLPRSIHLILGQVLGQMLYLSSMKRNNFSKKNINLCLPAVDESQRGEIHKLNILLSGRIPFDSGISWFWSDRRINS